MQRVEHPLRLRGVLAAHPRGRASGAARRETQRGEVRVDPREQAADDGHAGHLPRLEASFALAQRLQALLGLPDLAA